MCQTKVRLHWDGNESVHKAIINMSGQFDDNSEVGHIYLEDLLGRSTAVKVLMIKMMEHTDNRL